MRNGACWGMDPNVFHPARNASTKLIRDTCARCDYTEACLAYALKHRLPHGWWGGKSAKQRSDMLAGRPPKPERVAVVVNPNRPLHSLSAHGVAIRRLLADGRWHTLDEVYRYARPFVKDAAGKPRTARYARSVTMTTLHNMRRRDPVEYCDQRGYRLVATPVRVAATITAGKHSGTGAVVAARPLTGSPLEATDV